MNRLVLAAVVLVSSVVLVALSPDSLAQGKKGAKGTIELVESKDGKYRFTIRDAEGKYLGGSTVGHATEKGAKEAVEEMKRVLESATFVSKKAEGKDKK